MDARRSAFTRTIRVGVCVTGVVLATLVATAPDAASVDSPLQPTPFAAGTGSAIALAYKVNPLFGNLSFGITAGESVAAHQNTGSTAQSKAINLGVVGITLATEGCKGAEPTLASERQPQPVVVNADDEGAAQGRTGEEAGGAITMSARANKDPFAEAVTSIASRGDLGSVFIGSGTSRAASGVTDPGVRQARAVTELGEVALLGGVVNVRGMRWEAVHQSGGATVSRGTFDFGSLSVLGVPIPLPDDPAGRLRVLGDTLRPLGLAIDIPTARVDGSVVSVGPLTVGIVPSDLRDGILGPVLGEIRPIREALTAAFFQVGCKGSANVLGNNAPTIVTILDLALGAVSGAGSLTLELGGVQATTSDIVGFSGLGVGAAPPTAPGLGPVAPSTGPASYGPGFTGPPPILSDPSTAPGGIAIHPIDDLRGQRGGALLGVACGGLALLLATAELDRRKMRRAQSQASAETP